MYTKRLQLVNYGPIKRLDIVFPFTEETPRPIVFVGENGSGKSIVLSHIVNGLLLAKSLVFSETPEVEQGKVYKLRSSSYIKTGEEGYFAQVDFEDGFHFGEIRTRNAKDSYATMPSEFRYPDAEKAWNSMERSKNDSIHSNIDVRATERLSGLFSKNCVLHIPANRFEEPAWLNQDNLTSRAEYMDLTHIVGRTDRRVICYSPLRDIQNWLFEIAYDRAAFEVQTGRFGNLAVRAADNTYAPLPAELPLFLGYQGPATRTYELVLSVIRQALKLDNTGRLGIGSRVDRVVSVVQAGRQLVHNLFHLSSGETSLISMFLSILRDFDFCNVGIQEPKSVRGIAVIDEIDLHLHSAQQYEILPSLVSMFPNVQFVVTSHSPLFVLGLSNALGKDGFDLYLLPAGKQIEPEEFGEFEEAYHAFRNTRRYISDVRAAVEEADKPIVFVDGSTDVRYLTRASEVLGYQYELSQIELRAGGGDANLKGAWNALKSPAIRSLIQHMVVLVHDCDSRVGDVDGDKVVRRRIPLIDEHPIKEGIENLFSRNTIERARAYKAAFIDIDPARTKTVRGKGTDVPERWTVNEDEKTNLCNWICDNGSVEDFGSFRMLFDQLTEVAGLCPPEPEDSTS